MILKTTIALLTCLLATSCVGLDRWSAGYERGDGEFGKWGVEEDRLVFGLSGPIDLQAESHEAVDHYDPKADMISISERLDAVMAKVESVEASQSSLLELLKDFSGPGALASILAYLGWQARTKKRA